MDDRLLPNPEIDVEERLIERADALDPGFVPIPIAEGCDLCGAPLGGGCEFCAKEVA